MLQFLFSLFLANLHFSTRSEKITLFASVFDPGSCGSPTKFCSGSEADPFPSLIFALRKINNDAMPDDITLNLLEESTAYQLQGSDALEFLLDKKPAINLTIRSEGKKGGANIVIGLGDVFFVIPRKLTIENVNFYRNQFKPSSGMSKFLIPLGVTNSLFQLPNKPFGAHELELRSCDFKSISSISPVYYFSLFYIAVASGVSVALKITNTQFFHVDLPGGLIFADNKDKESLLLIELTNATIQSEILVDYGSAYIWDFELLAKASISSDDAIAFGAKIVIGNDVTLIVNSSRITNTGRTFYLHKNNIFIAENLRVDSNAPFKSFEAFMAISFNKMYFTGLVVDQIKAYDDHVEALPAPKESDEEIDYRYGKGIFNFRENNTATFLGCNFTNIDMWKADLGSLSLIVLHRNNSLLIDKCNFLGFIEGTDSLKGILVGLLSARYSNKIAISTSNVTDHFILACKHFTTLALHEKNELVITSIRFYNYSMKSRLNVMDIASLSADISKRVLSATSVRELIFEEMIYMTLIALNFNNMVKVYDSFHLKISRLYGCLAALGFNNTLTYRAAYFTNIIAETSGSITLALKNKVLVELSNMTNIRNVQGGVFYSIRENTITIQDTMFINISTVPYIGVEIDIKAEGSIVSAALDNTITLNRCIGVLLMTFERGGAFALINKNTLNLRMNIFQYINSFRVGGFLYMEMSNFLIARSSIFSNITAINGGVIFAETKNSIQIIDCNMSQTKTFVGGVLQVELQNQIQMRRTRFESIMASSEGSLALLNDENVIIVVDCSFSYFETRMISGLIHGITANRVIIEGGEWNEGKQSFGSFLYLERGNEGVLRRMDFVGFADKNVFGFFVLLLQNNLELADCSFKSFENRLIGAKIMNSVIGSNILITEFSLNDNNGSMVLVSQNTLSFSQVQFVNVQSFISAIISANDRNSMEFNNGLIDNFSIYNNEGSFFVENLNKLFVNNFKIIKVSGARVRSLLLTGLSGNEINFVNCSLSEEILSLMNHSFFFYLQEENTVNISNMSIKGVYAETPKFPPSLFNLKFLNLLIIENIRIEVRYFRMLLYIRRKNKVMINKMLIKRSLLTEDAILVFPESSLFLNTTTLIDIEFLAEENSTFFYIDEAQAIIFRLNIIGKEKDAAFFVTYASFLKLMGVQFNFCKKNKNSPITRKGHPKILLFLKSECLVSYFSMFCAVCSYQNYSNFHVDNSSLFVERSSFHFNIAEWAGGVFFFSGLGIIRVYKSHFIGNRARFGAVVFLKQIRGEYAFYANHVMMNKAFRIGDTKGRGGFFYYENAEKPKKIYFVFNYIVANKADIGAIGFCSDDKLPISLIRSNNTLKKNSYSLYGEILGAPSENVGLVDTLSSNPTPSDDIAVAKEILSNQEMVKPLFYVVGYDFYKQMTLGVREFATRDILVNFTMDYPPFGVSNYSLVFSHSDLTLGLTKIKDVQRNPFAKKLLFTFSSHFFLESQPEKNFSFSVTFRNCIIGEYFDGLSQQCTPCPPWFYSFENNFSVLSTCQRCINSHPFFCYGGNNITNKPGFWRLSMESGVFMRCPNPRACSGDTEGPGQFLIADYSIEAINFEKGVNICEKGYSGVLCAECEPGYGNTGNFACSRCDSAWVYVVMVVKVIFKFFIVSYSFFNAIILSRALALKTVNPHLINSNFLFKSLLGHCQALFIIASFPINIPQTFYTIYLSSIGVIAPEPGDTFTFECITKRFGLNAPLLYFNMILVLFYPAVILIIVIIYYAVIKKDGNFHNGQNSQAQADPSKKRSTHSYLVYARRRKLRPSLMDRIQGQISIEGTILIIIMINYPDIMKTYLEIFSYIPINNKNLLIRDLSIDFDSETHKNWRNGLGMPVLVIIGILIPIYLFVNITKLYGCCKRKGHSRVKTDDPSKYKIKKQNTMNTKALFKYGYFFFPYKDSSYYYDFVFLLRKVLLIVLQVFYINFLKISDRYNSFTFALLILIILSVFKAVHSQLHPFNDSYFSLINRVESWSLYVQISSSYLCLLWLVNQEDFESTIGSRKLISVIIAFIVISLAILINIAFLCFWGYIYLKFGLMDLKKGIKSVKSAINQLEKKLSTLKDKIVSSVNEISDSLRSKRSVSSEADKDSNEKNNASPIISDTRPRFSFERRTIINSKKDVNKARKQYNLASPVSSFQRYEIRRPQNLEIKGPGKKTSARPGGSQSSSAEKEKEKADKNQQADKQAEKTSPTKQRSPVRNLFSKYKDLKINIEEDSKQESSDIESDLISDENKSGHILGVKVLETPSGNRAAMKYFYPEERKELRKALVNQKRESKSLLRELIELKRDNERMQAQLGEFDRCKQLLKLLKREVKQLRLLLGNDENQMRNSLESFCCTENIGGEARLRPDSINKSIGKIKMDNSFSNADPSSGHKDNVQTGEISDSPEISVKFNSKPLNFSNYNISATDRESLCNYDIDEPPLQSTRDFIEKPLSISLLSKRIEGKSFSDYFLSLQFEVRAHRKLNDIHFYHLDHEDFLIAQTPSKKDLIPMMERDSSKCFHLSIRLTSGIKLNYAPLNVVASIKQEERVLNQNFKVRLGFQDFLILEEEGEIRKSVEEQPELEARLTSLYEGESCMEKFSFLLKNAVRFDKSKYVSIVRFPSENTRTALILYDETPSQHSQEIHSLKMQSISQEKKRLSNPSSVEWILKTFTSL